jgi:hypothetical protein
MGSAFRLVNAEIKAAAIDAIGPLGNARETGGFNLYHPAN